MKKIILVVTVVMLVGCATRWQQTVNDYMALANQVEFGMTKQQVETILRPTQKRLGNTEIKQPDRYVKNGVNVDIIYYRSGWQSDGITTDDEFTPYLFNNNKLVAIGWTTLGGPKTQGQARSSTYVYVQSNTIVY